MTAGTRVGCCGFAMAQRDDYARFAVVEVQQTFYDPPRPQTLARWRAQAPAQFEFTLKAWQLITHEPSSCTTCCTATTALATVTATGNCGAWRSSAAAPPAACSTIPRWSTTRRASGA